jgi:hypothetical protein
MRTSVLGPPRPFRQLDIKKGLTGISSETRSLLCSRLCRFGCKAGRLTYSEKDLAFQILGARPRCFLN